MSQAVKLNLFYPYPPERVWQVLTDRRALATWMMDNDFEPKLGHKFRFHHQPIPGLTTTIHCKVVELEEPTRLAYTWQDAPTAEPSLVIWTLTAVTGGTQLHLRHYAYSYTTAVAAAHPPDSVARAQRDFREFQPEMMALKFEVPSARSTWRYPPSSLPLETSLFPASPRPFFEWADILNQKLPDLLAQQNRMEG